MACPVTTHADRVLRVWTILSPGWEFYAGPPTHKQLRVAESGALFTCGILEHIPTASLLAQTHAITNRHGQ